MSKYAVWVKYIDGYASRVEEANSPEEAKATVQAFIDEGLDKHLSFKERLMGMEGFTVVGVQDYDQSQQYTTGKQVEDAFGLTERF